MISRRKQIRVLYSYAFKMGGGRLSDAAWQNVNAIDGAGAKVLACPGVLHRALPSTVEVWPTLARGRLRIPYRVLGKMRALALHDRIVARRLPALVGKIDIVHGYAAGSLETFKMARRLGITSVLERSNAYTRFAFEVVNRESERLGIKLPPTDEYYFREDLLAKEEAEYEAADYILCPSSFVVRTFVERCCPRQKLVQHFNGVDTETFHPAVQPPQADREFTMLFVGEAAVRKGVHFALDAWLKSPASKTGKFLIAGKFLNEYAEKMKPSLSHPSVQVLGRVPDVAELMRNCDILVLPSIEEGFGRVVTEAMASGCVPLASDACTELCRHLDTGLVHRAGDIAMLSEQITQMYKDRNLWTRLRDNGIRMAPQLTWAASGRRIVEVYEEILASKKDRMPAAVSVDS